MKPFHRASLVIFLAILGYALFEFVWATRLKWTGGDWQTFERFEPPQTAEVLLVVVGIASLLVFLCHRLPPKA